MTKQTLVASSPDLETLQAMLNAYYYNSIGYRIDPETLEVTNIVIAVTDPNWKPNVFVKFNRGRYKLYIKK